MSGAPVSEPTPFELPADMYARRRQQGGPMQIFQTPETPEPENILEPQTLNAQSPQPYLDARQLAAAEERFATKAVEAQSQVSEKQIRLFLLRRPVLYRGLDNYLY